MRRRLWIFVGACFFLVFLYSGHFSPSEENSSTQKIENTMEPVNEPLSRENYRPFDFREKQRSSIHDEEAENVRKNIMDPWMIVMNEYIQGPYTPDQISIFFPKGDKPMKEFNARGDGAKWEENYLVFILLFDPTRGDDSVAGQEIRLDFQKVNDQWQVIWSGMRFRCARGENKGRWIKELCP